jgi:hypothetical protein
MNTAEQVVDILKNEGHYRELPRPFKIGTLSFEFTSALIATEKANDLVIVIDLKSDVSDEGAVRKVHALTRALDVVQSRRSVTAVLTQGQASSETVYVMSRVCRVLPIGERHVRQGVCKDMGRDLRVYLAVVPAKQAVS